MVFPLPGEPIIRSEWRRASAISSARRAEN